jgi:predicted acyl esterase
MHKSEIADGMQIEWDVPIQMQDGVVLRADIFRPIGDGKCPAIMSHGPYGKGLWFGDGYKIRWETMIRDHPDVVAGTSAKYANFETVDPEKWVPDGYACIRIDSRGAGRSEGVLRPKSAQENEDLYHCIEWAAAQPWCNGKVGLSGISYYATNQWWVAGMQPPHLAAICPWEGAADFYRDSTRHGGILSSGLPIIFALTILRVQHGSGEHGGRSRITGELVTGPEVLTDEELANNRVEYELLDHPLDDEFYRERASDWSDVTVPVLSAANWGGHGLHPRGNFEGYMRAASEQKWLEAHGLNHNTHFYTDYGVNLQKRFFGHFLKGEDTGWNEQPPVQLQIRHVDRFVVRHENEWPIGRTQWTKYYLHPGMELSPHSRPNESETLAYDPAGDGLLFLTPPVATEIEITGPVAAKLLVSSGSTDADLFLLLRVFAPDGKEVVFDGANDPRTPVAFGWLRASHRKLDAELSLLYRPYHAHDEKWPLRPGIPVELDVEILPTSIVVPPGYRIGLSVRGRDYRYDGPPIHRPDLSYELSGVGPFVHNNPQDRPPEIFGATVTLHFDPAQPNYILLPVIPPKF